MVFEDLWGCGAFHKFKFSFVNIIYLVSSLPGSACIIRRRTRFVPSFDFYIFIPSQRVAIDALLIAFLSSKYPPIDCTNISLREESKTASELQISFVIFLEAGGEPCSGQHISWESLFYLYYSKRMRWDWDWSFGASGVCSHGCLCVWELRRFGKRALSMLDAAGIAYIGM